MSFKFAPYPRGRGTESWRFETRTRPGWRGAAGGLRSRAPHYVCKPDSGKAPRVGDNPVKRSISGLLRTQWRNAVSEGSVSTHLPGGASDVLKVIYPGNVQATRFRIIVFFFSFSSLLFFFLFFFLFGHDELGTGPRQVRIREYLPRAPSGPIGTPSVSKCAGTATLSV